jgi:hypothetical protein
MRWSFAAWAISMSDGMDGLLEMSLAALG